MGRKVNGRKKKTAGAGRIVPCAVFFAAVMIGYTMNTATVRTPILAVAQLAIIAGLTAATSIAVVATMKLGGTENGHRTEVHRNP